MNLLYELKKIFGIETDYKKEVTEKLDKLIKEVDGLKRKTNEKDSSRILAIKEEVHNLYLKNEKIQKETHNTYSKVQKSQEEIHNIFNKVQKSQEELHNTFDKVQKSQEEIHNMFLKVHKIQEETHNIYTRVELVKNELHNAFISIKEKKSVIEKLENKVEDNNKEIKRIIERQGGLGRTTNEILWSMIFNNTINQDSWLKDKSFSPGRWAAGYPMLYVIYRVLNEFKPKNILELGLGQTTKMISQYVKSNDGINHIVVEHDKEWTKFFLEDVTLPKETKMLFLDLENSDFLETKVCRYSGFKDKLKDQKYDFIIIDAPYGGDENVYSRVDMLDLIPNCLAQSFVIIMDDYNRAGEKNTINLLLEKLTEISCEYTTRSYEGQKSTFIITSRENSFLCSL